MAEPTTSTAIAGVSLITLATALLGPAIGPLLGPYVVIILCSAVGAQWAVIAAPESTRTQAALLMLRLVGTAVALTAMIAQLVAAWAGVGVTEAYGLVSFAIGAFGHRWTEIFNAVKDRVLGVVRNGRAEG